MIMCKRFKVNPSLSITPIESVKLPEILAGLQCLFLRGNCKIADGRAVSPKPPSSRHPRRGSPTQSFANTSNLKYLKRY